MRLQPEEDWILILGGHDFKETQSHNFTAISTISCVLGLSASRSFSQETNLKFVQGLQPWNLY